MPVKQMCFGGLCYWM